MKETKTPVGLPQGKREAEQKPVPCEKLTGFVGHHSLSSAVSKIANFCNIDEVIFLTLRDFIERIK